MRRAERYIYIYIISISIYIYIHACVCTCICIRFRRFWRKMIIRDWLTCVPPCRVAGRIGLRQTMHKKRALKSRSEPRTGQQFSWPFLLFFGFLFFLMVVVALWLFTGLSRTRNELKQMSVWILLQREKGIYIGYSYYCNWGARIRACLGCLASMCVRQMKYGQRQNSQYFYEKMPCHQFCSLCSGAARW